MHANKCGNNYAIIINGNSMLVNFSDKMCTINEAKSVSIFADKSEEMTQK